VLGEQRASGLAASHVEISDFNALLVFKKGLGSLDGLADWKNHSSPCEWIGVSCKGTSECGFFLYLM
jgi:hypothetical protein